MMLKPKVRKFIALIGGVALPVLVFFWAVYASGFALNIFKHTHGLASNIGSDAIYKKFADIYTFLGIFSLCFAAGVSFAILFWERRPSQMRVQVVFWVLLAIIIPLSFLNYWSGDIFVSRSKQALIDIVLVFLGTFAVISISKIKVQSLQEKVFRGMVVLFISMQAVFIPGIYAILWLLNWQKAISLANTKDWTPGWISTASGIV